MIGLLIFKLLEHGVIFLVRHLALDVSLWFDRAQTTLFKGVFGQIISDFHRRCIDQTDPVPLIDCIDVFLILDGSSIVESVFHQIDTGCMPGASVESIVDDGAAPVCRAAALLFVLGIKCKILVRVHHSHPGFPKQSPVDAMRDVVFSHKLQRSGHRNVPADDQLQLRIVVEQRQ